MTSKPQVYFRADGSNAIGLGHVIRSLALAEMLKSDFECHFIIRNPGSSLVDLIDQFVVSVIVLPSFDSYESEAIFIAKELLPEKAIIVLDGYNFDTKYQSIIKTAKRGLVCIDDIHAYHFVADCVINHAPGQIKSQYSLDPETQLFHGPSYSLLRSPFLKAASEPNEINEIKEVFICFGGGDKDNITEKILRLILEANLPLNRVNIILGKAYLFKDSIVQLAKDCKDIDVCIFSDLSAEGMVDILKQSHLAIVPASSILYEAIAVKMPIISGYYVDNQINVYHGFKELGVIEGVGDFHNISDFKSLLQKFDGQYIRKMMDLQSALKIQDSSKNLVDIIKKLNKKIGNQIFIRNTNKEDLMLYFDWVNDDAVRTNSINQSLITIEDHRRWFLSKLDSEETIMYMLMKGDNPIGQIRFDFEDRKAFIDYSVSSNSRGQGYGKVLIERGIEALSSQVEDVDEIIGIVKSSNIASNKVFMGLGFEVDTNESDDSTLIRFKFPLKSSKLKSVG